ncbi:MAG: hypothetical protein QF369_04230 [Dehalococcoidales bacterium]|nr:hypothetical protein [Dehalococcoidales bacterium]
MSILIDKLNRISRGSPQPMGFTPRQPASDKPKMQLVVSFAVESAGSLAGRAAGADAGLLRISKPGTGAEALQEISKTLPNIAWGVGLRGISRAGLKQIARAGSDFVVFPATDTPLTALEDNKTGRILEVPESLDEGLFRAINQLPVDAVLVVCEEKESPVLTWQNLILCQRLAGLLTKPLLVSVPSQVTAPELVSLWETGVAAVVIEITEKQPVDSLKKLRQAVDKLEFASPRGPERAEARLPRTGGTTSPASTGDDEEEDEEEY